MTELELTETEFNLTRMNSFIQKLECFIESLQKLDSPEKPGPEVLNTLESFAEVISITWAMKRSSDECAKWKDFELFWKEKINIFLGKRGRLEKFA